MSGWHFSLLQRWSLLLLLLEKASGASSWGGFLLEMWSPLLLLRLLLLEQVGGAAASSWGGRIPPGRELASKCTCCLREDDGVSVGSWELSSFARLLLGLLLRIRLSCGAIPSQLSLLSGGYSSSSSSSSDGFLSLSLSLPWTSPSHHESCSESPEQPHWISFSPFVLDCSSFPFALLQYPFFFSFFWVWPSQHKKVL